MSFSTKDIGSFGEKICLKYLKKQKYKILDTNARIGHLETDIIAINKTHIIFTEVKTRNVNNVLSLRPSSAIDKQKQINLRSFAYAYIKKLPPKYKLLQPRMDTCEILIAVENEKIRVCDLNYIEGAF